MSNDDPQTHSNYLIQNYAENTDPTQTLINKSAHPTPLREAIATVGWTVDDSYYLVRYVVSSFGKLHDHKMCHPVELYFLCRCKTFSVSLQYICCEGSSMHKMHLMISYNMRKGNFYQIATYVSAIDGWFSSWERLIATESVLRKYFVQNIYDVYVTTQLIYLPIYIRCHSNSLLFSSLYMLLCYIHTTTVHDTHNTDSTIKIT